MLKSSFFPPAAQKASQSSTTIHPQTFLTSIFSPSYALSSFLSIIPPRSWPWRLHRPVFSHYRQRLAASAPRLMNRHDINTKLGLDSRIEELIYESAANMRTFTTSASQV